MSLAGRRESARLFNERADRKYRRRVAGRHRGQAPEHRGQIGCPPDLSIYAFFPAVDNRAPQVCQAIATTTRSTATVRSTR
jgi:hypothetical protein